MTHKELIITVVKAKFGVEPTDEQLSKLQALAKDSTIKTDVWVKMAEKIMAGQ